MLNRRQALLATAGAPLGGFGAYGAETAKPVFEKALPAGVRDTAVLDALPGKKPLLKLSYRPPNYETPLSYFDELYTPNDAFFVRYHLSDIPDVDGAKWALKLGGASLNSAQSISMEQLKQMPAVEIAAVCQCSGNRRGLADPHVPGVQWGYGAMGNARWKGVRLKDVLAKAGVKDDALEVVINGADGPVLDKTPDFIKSLPIGKAMDENTILAYEMNGAPLPPLNGFPVRLIVPGWTATYWMKHVTSIDVVPKPYDGFWMKSAYRIPLGKFAILDRFISQETPQNTPITEMVVNSVITTPADGATVQGAGLTVKGVAWDGGYGIASVDVSIDGGKSWHPTVLGPDAGRYSFRQWSLAVPDAKRGALTVMARASNKAGQAQVAEPIANPAGYHHNAMHRVSVTVA